MIPLKKQVACRKSSKELKELGLPQESQWYWLERGRLDIISTKPYHIHLVDKDHEMGQLDIDKYSAPTCAELGTILPAYFRTYKFKRNDGKEYGFACDNDIDESQWDDDELRRLMKSDLYKEYRYEEADTEADAKAKMVVSLLKDNLIKIGKSKERTNEKR